SGFRDVYARYPGPRRAQYDVPLRKSVSRLLGTEWPGRKLPLQGRMAGPQWPSPVGFRLRGTIAVPVIRGALPHGLSGAALGVRAAAPGAGVSRADSSSALPAARVLSDALHVIPRAG